MPTLPLDDGTIWYEETGSGPPLVCLHGGWQNTDSWRGQIDRFADEYRVVTFDLRGHGRTGATGPRRYSIDLFVDDLERLLDHLDVESPVLCGISIGGLVIQSYLDRHPEETRGAVVGGPLQTMPPVDIPAGVKPFVSPVPAVAGMVSTLGPTATFQWLLGAIRATTGGPWLALDPEVRSQAMDALGDVTADEYLKIFRALYRFEPPDLSDVQTPALVLAGDRESPLVKRQGERLAGTLPHGTYREIPGAAHLVNQDNPGAFDAACAEFFATLEADAPAPSPGR